MAYQDPRETIEVTIANAASLSGAAVIGGRVLIGVITPAVWTAAAISFEGSNDGTTFYPMYDQAAELTIATGIISATEARYFAVDHTEFAGLSSIKVRSGVNGTPVAQGAARTVKLVVRGV